MYIYLNVSIYILVIYKLSKIREIQPPKYIRKNRNLF